MKIAVHAGHNPDGMVACGAVGYIKESTAAREVVNILVQMLNSIDGYEAKDLTVNNGVSQSNVLFWLVTRTNMEKADLTLSIHFNSHENASANGTECWIHGTAKLSTEQLADSISDHVCDTLGTKRRKTQRSTGLYILNKTEMPCILVECLFVTNKADCERYDPHAIAAAICYAITEEEPQIPTTTIPIPEETHTDAGKVLYRVQVGAFQSYENAKKLKNKMADLGYDVFITQGG